MPDKSNSEKPKSAAATDSPDFPIARPRTLVVTLQNCPCLQGPAHIVVEQSCCFSVLTSMKVELTSPHPTKMTVVCMKGFDLKVTSIKPVACKLCSLAVEWGTGRKITKPRSWGKKPRKWALLYPGVPYLPNPHSELLIPSLPSSRAALCKTLSCQMEKEWDWKKNGTGSHYSDVQVLFALERALHLSEPCLFSLGVVFSVLASAWMVEDQSCTMNRGLSPLSVAI